MIIIPPVFAFTVRSLKEDKVVSKVTESGVVRVRSVVVVTPFTTMFPAVLPPIVRVPAVIKPSSVLSISMPPVVAPRLMTPLGTVIVVAAAPELRVLIRVMSAAVRIRTRCRASS